MSKTSSNPSSDWPGRRLGYPEFGSGSFATIPRRLGAMALDWGFAVLISFAFFEYDAVMTLLIFALWRIIFTVSIGASLGQKIFGLRVQSVSGEWAGIWAPVIRTALICVVVPMIIVDADGRGLHDRVAGTAIVKA